MYPGSEAMARTARIARQQHQHYHYHHQTCLTQSARRAEGVAMRRGIVIVAAGICECGRLDEDRRRRRRITIGILPPPPPLVSMSHQTPTTSHRPTAPPSLSSLISLSLFRIRLWQFAVFAASLAALDAPVTRLQERRQSRTAQTPSHGLHVR